MTAPDAAIDPFLSEVRAATRPAHERLDARLRLRGLATRERYAAFLRGTLAAVEPLEARIAAHWQGPLLSRAALLRADLAALGDAAELGAEDVPALGSIAEAMGAAYVIEGSSLGGAVLAREFEKALGLDKSSLHYLTLDGLPPGQRWKQFLGALSAWSANATPEERGQACRTASATFSAYERALERAGALGPQS